MMGPHARCRAVAKLINEDSTAARVRNLDAVAIWDAAAGCRTERGFQVILPDRRRSPSPTPQRIHPILVLEAWHSPVLIPRPIPTWESCRSVPRRGLARHVSTGCVDMWNWKGSMEKVRQNSGAGVEVQLSFGAALAPSEVVDHATGREWNRTGFADGRNPRFRDNVSEAPHFPIIFVLFLCCFSATHVRNISWHSWGLRSVVKSRATQDHSIVK